MIPKKFRKIESSPRPHSLLVKECAYCKTLNESISSMPLIPWAAPLCPLTRARNSTSLNRSYAQYTIPQFVSSSDLSFQHSAARRSLGGATMRVGGGWFALFSVWAPARASRRPCDEGLNETDGLTNWEESKKSITHIVEIGRDRLFVLARLQATRHQPIHEHWKHDNLVLLASKGRP